MPAGAPVLMLVPHDPGQDPRILWVRDLCAELAPVQILGAVSTVQRQKVEYDGRTYVHRVDAYVHASPAARRISVRLAQLQYRRACVAYLERAEAGAGPPPGLRGALWHQYGAALKLVSAAAWFNFIDSALWRRARSVCVPPAVVICHDLYSLRAGLRVKRRFGCPLIYDSHEFWPVADLLSPPFEQRAVAAYERGLIRRADVVVTVSPGVAAELERTYGLKDVVVAPNAAPLEPDVIPSSSRPPGRPVRFLFQGGVAPRRGIDELLEGWRGLADLPAVLSIRAPDNPHLAGLRDRHADQVRAGRVEFLPAVTEAELIRASTFADVGVIPYPGDNLNHRHACPNKLSQYMQAGVALLVNDLSFVRQVTEEHRCGRVYDARRPETLVAAVRWLVADTERLAVLKRNARAGSSQFNWATRSTDYRRAIETLLGSRR